MSERLDGIAHFDISIMEKNLDTAVKTLISHLKKSWDISRLQKQVYDDGITNKLIGYFVDRGNLKCSTQFGEYGRSDIVLFRIYGVKTELIIDRAQELRNFQELSREGIAPSLYCTFNNGYCYQYVEGYVLKPRDIQNPDILDLSAKTIAKLHSIKLSTSYLTNHPMKSTLFDTIYKYIKLIPKSYNCPEKQKRFLEQSLTADMFRQEVDTISKLLLESKNMKITFCHNDLLMGNFILNEEKENLFLIDYEYGTPNYVAYDIANHFNEFAGVDDVDYSLFPDMKTQMNFLRTYLLHCNELNGEKEEFSDNDLEELYTLVNKFTLVSHLFWGIWALIQAHNSTIDFDFMGYSFIRINEYFKRKSSVFADEKSAEQSL